MDESIFDILPYYPGHLITVKLNHWILDLDLLRGRSTLRGRMTGHGSRGSEMRSNETSTSCRFGHLEG